MVKSELPSPEKELASIRLRVISFIHTDLHLGHLTPLLTLEELTTRLSYYIDNTVYRDHKGNLLEDAEGVIAVRYLEESLRKRALSTEIIPTKIPDNDTGSRIDITTKHYILLPEVADSTTFMSTVYGDIEGNRNRAVIAMVNGEIQAKLMITETVLGHRSISFEPPSIRRNPTTKRQVKVGYNIYLINQENTRRLYIPNSDNVRSIK